MHAPGVAKGATAVTFKGAAYDTNAARPGHPQDSSTTRINPDKRYKCHLCPCKFVFAGAMKSQSSSPRRAYNKFSFARRD